ncbi:unnamed protein product [Strongylus vulgaris]|uniref:Glucuronosyltransferase n=1 Tax=Strongylus vulgaris TaxID=40348 RepID=A0A3P7I540_STRVU|nr:unnamed protein product [Strongylus vulgaris]
MGYSHMNFMGKIADTLADAGHYVVTLQPVIFPYVSNGTTKSHLIQRNVEEKLTAEVMRAHQQYQPNIWTSSATNPLGVIGFLPTFKRITMTTVTGKKIAEEVFRYDFPQM